MAASIVLTGLASNDPVPGTYLQISFAQGTIGGYQGKRPILLIGNKTSAGSATNDTVLYGPDTPVPCQTQQDVINLFGPGSELHRMWLRVTKWNTTTSIYFIAQTTSAGAAATMTFTLVNVPSASGTLNVWAADQQYQFGFAASATLASITAGMVSAINGNAATPVVATQTTVTSTNDSVLLTAKCAGTKGNWLRGQASVAAATGGTLNMTVTNTADAFFTSGTTADSNTNALATIIAKRFYYIVSADEDSTNVSALSAQVLAQALPVAGLRQRVFVGSVDTSGNITTIANAVNNARVEFIWSQGSQWTPAELAANAAGIYSLYEAVSSGVKPRINWSGYGNGANDNWNVPQSRNTTLGPTRTTIYGLLGNGVTPIGWNGSTSTYLVKRITSYSLNGSNPDYRIRDAGKVTICDFFGDDLVALTIANWQGRTIGTDPVVGAPFPDNTVITPNLYRLDVTGLVNQYGQAQMLVNVAATLAAMIVQADPANTNRLDVSIPLYTCSPCDQFAIQALQVA
jgi:phage tail sheath gpL-like